MQIPSCRSGAQCFRKGSRIPTVPAAIRRRSDERWDYVSFQQASGVSGEYETYEPYLLALQAYVRRRVPAAAICQKAAHSACRKPFKVSK